MKSSRICKRENDKHKKHSIIKSSSHSRELYSSSRTITLQCNICSFGISIKCSKYAYTK